MAQNTRGRRRRLPNGSNGVCEVNIIPNGPVLILQALSFLLVIIVLGKYLFKPVLAILEARGQEIESQYQSADAQKKAAEELRAGYEKRLAEIDEEKRAKITEAVKEGQTIREEIINESREKADSILTKAQDEITREKEIALAEIKGKVADLTIAAAGKLIDENLDDKKHRELVDKYIADLDEVAR